MKNTTIHKKNGFSRWFFLCPVRHILIFIGIGLITAYFALRRDALLMQWTAAHIVRPVHIFFGSLFNYFDFSVAECIYAIVIIGLVIYLLTQLASILREQRRWTLIYRTAATFLAAATLFYGGFCALWGVYYQTSDFTNVSGVPDKPVTVDELATVTLYFAGLANSYADEVSRDENGCFTADRNAVFERSANLYDNVSVLFPCLDGPALRAKPMVFSKVMSFINFTGFFFPFTGEANLNNDSPVCLLPSTLAHEIAHQRGVAREDQANFVAVLACLSSGDADYAYSACLLAYIHLGNALHGANAARWQTVYDSLSAPVLADLAQNRAYWQHYDTAAAKVTDTVYSGFLSGYGEERGTKSYGACVDLLVAYYGQAAQAAMDPQAAG